MSAYFISQDNYKVGIRNVSFPKGKPFTREQWVEAGGKEAGMDHHIKKGYIQPWKQEVPQAAQAVKAPIEVEAVVVKVEAPVKEEAPVTDKPSGIWTFKLEDLEGRSIEELNAMYLGMAKKNGINARAYTDIDRLKAKLISEA